MFIAEQQQSRLCWQRWRRHAFSETKINVHGSVPIGGLSLLLYLWIKLTVVIKTHQEIKNLVPILPVNSTFSVVWFLIACTKDFCCLLFKVATQLHKNWLFSCSWHLCHLTFFLNIIYTHIFSWVYVLFIIQMFHCVQYVTVLHQCHYLQFVSMNRMNEMHQVRHIQHIQHSFLLHDLADLQYHGHILYLS